MFHDQHLSASLVLAVTLWVVSAIVMTIGLFTDLRVIGVGLFFAALAATATVRRMFCLAARQQRDIFEMGRDFAHGETRSNVRRL